MLTKLDFTTPGFSSLSAKPGGRHRRQITELAQKTARGRPHSWPVVLAALETSSFFASFYLLLLVVDI